MRRGGERQISGPRLGRRFLVAQAAENERRRRCRHLPPLERPPNMRVGVEGSEIETITHQRAITPTKKPHWKGG